MSPARSPASGGRLLLAAGLALAALLLYLPDLDRVGITWDEPHYFASAERIQAWTARLATGPDRAAALSPDAIAETWDAYRYWNPHPPFYKEVMAATEAAFAPLVGSLAGFRLAPLAFFALLVAAVAFAGTSAGGSAAGIGAGLAVLLMPRLAGHAHIAATDMPLAALWFLATLAGARWARGGRGGWLALAAAALGCALATKFTAWLLPVPLAVWTLAYGRGARAWTGLVAAAVAGVLVSWALNPLAWHDPLAETARVFRESLGRKETVPIFTWYLGRAWEFEVPWHHAVVMTAVTVPLPLLALSVVGAASTLRRLRDEPLGALCLVQILFFWALLALPGSPNHDGVRLFLPLFPFVGLLAGLGFGRLVRALRGRLAGRRAALAALATGALFYLPPYWQCVRVAPLYLSYYNEAIGGVTGAAEAGMEVTYWYDALTPAFLRRVNATLPAGARLGGFPTLGHLQVLQEYGALRDDIQLTEEWPPEWYLMLARQASFSPAHRGIRECVRPVLAVELDGVELVGLYRWSAGEVPPDPGPAADRQIDAGPGS